MAIFNKKTEDKKSAPKASMKDMYAQKTDAKNPPAGGGEGRAAGKGGKFGSAYRILIKPLVTEKASVAGAENKYIFEVSKDANKVEVAKSIKEVYGIQPSKVNIVRVLGKKSRYGKAVGKRKDRKKAIVTLPEGQSIKVYEGV